MNVASRMESTGVLGKIQVISHRKAKYVHVNVSSTDFDTLLLTWRCLKIISIGSCALSHPRTQTFETIVTQNLVGFDSEVVLTVF